MFRDDATMTEIRHALEERRIDTRTTGLRGEERRQLLLVRLNDALANENKSVIKTNKPAPIINKPIKIIRKVAENRIENNEDVDEEEKKEMEINEERIVKLNSINWDSATDLRHELEALQIDTRTPNLRGEERREVLSNRLKQSIGFIISTNSVPIEVKTKGIEERTGMDGERKEDEKKKESKPASVNKKLTARKVVEVQNKKNDNEENNMVLDIKQASKPISQLPKSPKLSLNPATKSTLKDNGPIGKEERECRIDQRYNNNDNDNEENEIGSDENNNKDKENQSRSQRNLEEGMVSTLEAKLKEKESQVHIAQEQVKEFIAIRNMLIKKRTMGPSKDKALLILEQDMDKVKDEVNKASQVTGRFIDSDFLQGTTQRFTVSDYKNQLNKEMEKLNIRVSEAKELIILEELSHSGYGQAIEENKKVEIDKLNTEIFEAKENINKIRANHIAESSSSKAVFIYTYRKNYPKAEELFDKALRSNPKHALSLLRFAIYQRDIQKDYSYADRLFRAAAKANTDSSEPLFELSVMLFEKKQYVLCEGALRRSLQINPNHVNSLSLLGNLHEVHSKDKEMALALYEKVLELSPCHFATLTSLAVLNQGLGNFDIAQEYFEKAIESNPNDAKVYSQYGLFLSQNKNDYINAKMNYEKSFQINSEDIQLLSNYASLCKNHVKDFEKAQELFLLALSKEPLKSSLLGSYAALCKLMGRFEECSEMYEKAMKCENVNATTIGNYANFLKNIKQDKEKAKEYYLRALKLEASNEIVARNYAIFLRDHPEMRQGTTVSCNGKDIQIPPAKRNNSFMNKITSNFRKLTPVFESTPRTEELEKERDGEV